jgi:hypothetical protein
MGLTPHQGDMTAKLPNVILHVQTKVCRMAARHWQTFFISIWYF